MVVLDTNIFIYLANGTLICAIKLRQARRLSLGDSLIAATALEHNLTLWTANTGDFNHVEDLKLLNPLA